jgi:hypothetical protein
LSRRKAREPTIRIGEDQTLWLSDFATNRHDHTG